MVNLGILDLHENQITDIASLKNLTNLTDLDLDDNNISNVSPLSGLVNLTILDLDGNNITDVSPLNGLVNLMILDISNNQITDFSPIAGLIGNLTEYDNSNQTPSAVKAADVNRDGVVNVQDLALVASYFRNPNFANAASNEVYPDVNTDGVVDIGDLVAVAAEIDATAAAPTLRKNLKQIPHLTAENLKQWIQLAKQLGTQKPHTQKGITVLEQLLAILISTEILPHETALLTNYPNPFNPETWIPYQLAEPAAVSISIHAADGKLVRTLGIRAFGGGYISQQISCGILGWQECVG